MSNEWKVSLVERWLRPLRFRIPVDAFIELLISGHLIDVLEQAPMLNTIVECKQAIDGSANIAGIEKRGPRETVSQTGSRWLLQEGYQHRP
jgi:hypothetical protein